MAEYSNLIHEENTLDISFTKSAYKCYILSEAIKPPGISLTSQFDVTKCYLLLLTKQSLKLILPDKGTAKEVQTWKYTHIRRYSYSKSEFSFEAGRKCATGEGHICFQVSDGEETYRQVCRLTEWITSHEQDRQPDMTTFDLQRCVKQRGIWQVFCEVIEENGDTQDVEEYVVIR